MDTDLALARAIHLPIALLARAGFAPAAALSPSEQRGSAHLLGRGLRLSLWQARRGLPSWEEVSSAWERAVDRRAGPDPSLFGRFHPRDRFTLLGDNAEAFAARAQLLAGARERIDLATYYLQADDTGRAAAGLLADAAARGVRVRLVADAYIMRKKEHEGLGSMRLVGDLRGAGVEVTLFSDPARPFDTNHRKLTLVDGRALLIGGRNLADHYAGPAWRDVELLVEGPSAASAEALFERTLRGDPEPDRADEPGPLVHGTTPAGLAEHPGFLSLLDRARVAERTIDIENAYYFSHPAVLRALAAARARGVRVRVFTNSAASNDLDWANYRLYAGFPALLDAGIELYLRRGKGRTLHSKYFVVDGAFACLGSSNFDYFSPRYCTEANLQVESAALGEALTGFFERGIAEADRLVDRAAVAAVRRAHGFSRALDAVMRDAQ